MIILISIIILVMLVIIFSYILSKYYFYSKHNVYSLKMVEMNLESFYGEREFEILNKQMNILEEPDGDYIFEYVATVTDGDIVFESVQIMRDKDRCGGHLYFEDYTMARNDYIRKKLEKEGIDISAYEKDFVEAVVDEEPDCIFTISKKMDNDDEIDAICRIIQEGIDIGKLDFWFKICAENGEEIVDSYELMKLFREGELDNLEIRDSIVKYIEEE